MTTKVKSKNSSSGYAYASIGINTLSSIFSSMIGLSSFKSQLEADTRNKINNMERTVSAFEFESIKTKEAIESMDSFFADKVSARGLQAMKDEALLRAGSAETGTSGGSTEEAVKEAYMTEAFDVGIINADRNRQKASVLANLGIKEEGVYNQLDALTSGGVTLQNNALLSGLGSFASLTGSNLSALSLSQRGDLFGLNTKSDVQFNKPDVPHFADSPTTQFQIDTGFSN